VTVVGSGTVNASLGHGRRQARSSSGSHFNDSVMIASSGAVVVVPGSVVDGAFVGAASPPDVPSVHAAAISVAARRRGTARRRIHQRCHIAEAIHGDGHAIR
jgi:hypothetical protein